MKKYLFLALSCILLLIICGSAAAAEIPSQNQVNLTVANDEGVRYNANGDNTYSYFYGSGGGLNTLKITDTNSSSATNKVINTNNQSGTFYMMLTGGTVGTITSFRDDGILMLAVNGTIPDNFALTVTASGYQWPLNSTVPGYSNLYYNQTTINETFTKNDFIYGPQIWKPSPVSNPDYPIYEQQNMNDEENQFNIMFIDLYAGMFRKDAITGYSLVDNGMIEIQYSFQNLPLGSIAVFNAYTYLGTAGNQPAGVEWTNLVNKAGESGASSGVIVRGTSIPNENYVTNTRTLEVFSNIQAAINDVDTINGDTLTAAGEFQENVVLNKMLNLVGQSTKIVAQIAANPVLTITNLGSGSTINGFRLLGSTNSGIYLDSATGVTLQGNTINGTGQAVWGICLVNSNGNTLTGNTVTNCEEGVNLYNSHQNVISGNTLKDNHWDNLALNLSILNTITGNTISNADSGIRLIGGSNQNTVTGNNLAGNVWTSISLVSSQNNQIENNILSNNQEGIYLYASDNNNLTGNTANNNIWDGIAIHDSDGNIITGHTQITGNQCGVRIIGSSTGNQVTSNTISANTWADISLDGATQNTISGNNLTDSMVGIYLEGATLNTITGNTITGNDWDGIDLINGSNSNTVTYNTITGSIYGERILSSNSNTSHHNNYTSNTVNAYDNGTNTWDNGTVGNYWSDYAGTGTYPIAGGTNVDNHPSTVPF